MAGEEAEAGGRARSEGQTLHRSGMVAEPVLRLPQAGLSAQRAMGRAHGQGCRKSTSTHGRRPRSTSSRSPTRSRRRISCSPIRNCCARRSMSKAENLVRGMHMLTEDIKAGHGNLKITPIRPQRVRGRPQSRAHARQGGFPERPHPAHPIRGDHAGSAENTAADRAAMDQQVLHPRSDAGKILHQVVRRSAGSPSSWCPGSIRTPSSPRKASSNTCAKACWRRSTPSRKRPARSRSTPSAIASAARCSRSRSLISPPSRTTACSPPRCSRRRSISPMPAT